MKSKYCKVLIWCDFPPLHFNILILGKRFHRDVHASGYILHSGIPFGRLAVILCLLCHFPQEASSFLSLRTAEHRIIPFQEVQCWLLSSLQGVWGVHSALHWPCTFPLERRILLWWHWWPIQQSWLIPAPQSFIKCFVLLDLTSWDHLVYLWLFHYLPLPLISAFPALLCHLQRLALITLGIIKWSA